MPWKETCVMDERTKFIGRLLEGEKMAPLCKEFGISRVTGHKIWNRYKENGNQGLNSRSRAPHKHPNQTPFEVEKLIIRLKKEKPSWGAPKIRELVQNKYPSIKAPSTSTVHSILDRHELVKKRRTRNIFHPTVSYLSTPTEPNDLWCTDFKGQFRMANREYCYPLTISDFATRYLFICESLNSNEENPCFPVFEQAFKEYGLPTAIRSDNGIPFACGNSMWNMTKLSVWWVRLGIRLERIKPGNPQQNGRHERMHRTLKLEAIKEPRANLLQQQETFDEFKQNYNFERPHQALDMKCPADVYKKSLRPYLGLPDLTYPGYDRAILVSSCGRVCIRKLKIHISKAFANQPVGLKAIDTGVWQVDFMSYTLGYFDEDSRKFSPNDDPFGLHLDGRP
jgi:putative transposase